jgi:hypothetical protein
MMFSRRCQKKNSFNYNDAAHFLYVFNPQKGDLLRDPPQHQSHLELKKDADEEFARKALLYNLKSLKNNVRATARAMNSSSHTVYLAIEKRGKGDFRGPGKFHRRFMIDQTRVSLYHDSLRILRR